MIILEERRAASSFDGDKPGLRLEISAAMGSGNGSRWEKFQSTVLSVLPALSCASSLGAYIGRSQGQLPLHLLPSEAGCSRDDRSTRSTLTALSDAFTVSSGCFFWPLWERLLHLTSPKRGLLQSNAIKSNMDFSKSRIPRTH